MQHKTIEDVELYFKELSSNKTKQEELIDSYTKAITDNPHNANAYLERGIIYNVKKELDLALSDFTKCIELDPLYQQAYMERILINQRLEKVNEVMADFDSLIALDKTNALSYSHRGKFLRSLNRNEEAIIDFKKAIHFDPEFEAAYHKLSLIYIKQNKYHEASAELTKAILLAPDEAWLYFSRAECYIEQTEKLPEMIFDSVKALNLDPSHELFRILFNRTLNFKNSKDVFDLIKNLSDEYKSKFLLKEALNKDTDLGNWFSEKEDFNFIKSDMEKHLTELLARENLRNTATVLYQGTKARHTLFGLPDLAKKIATMSVEDKMSREVAEQIIEDKFSSMRTTMSPK